MERFGHPLRGQEQERCECLPIGLASQAICIAVSDTSLNQYGDLPWAFRAEAEATSEEDGREHLKSPWHSPCLGALHEGAAIGDVVHDQNTPGDSPLLRTDDSTTLGGRRQLTDLSLESVAGSRSINHILTYTGTWAEAIPIDRPLMNRPATNIPMF